jgi:hypothetical protein
LQRNDLLKKIAALSVSGAGVRQTARVLGVSHPTVLLQLARAGRHCLLVHAALLRDLPIEETIVFDGFETFEHSQYFPFHFNVAAGHQSWFLYHFTDSPLRRKGRMTTVQKRRRDVLEASLGRPDPKAVERGVFQLLRGLLRQGRVRRLQAWRLHSDDHPAYPRALRRLRRMPTCPTLAHRVTSSSEPRTRANPLFPVNLADLLLRHCQANHRRETIAFAKRRQGAIERAAVFTVWRNAIKWRREKEPGTTAAMSAGALTKRLNWTDVFCRRRFPRREDLPRPWWSYYWRKVKTLALGENQRSHRRKYAF